MDKYKIRNIVGIVCIFGSIGGLISGKPIPAIFMLLFGISLLPIIYEKTFFKKHNKSCIYMPIIIFVILVITLGLNSDDSSNDNKEINIVTEETKKEENIVKEDIVKANDIIFDVTQFSNISSDRLIEIMGEPDEKENWKDTRNEKISYDVTIYTYSNKYEFFIWKDRVVKLNIFAYNIDELKNYNGFEKTLEQFNIKKSNKAVRKIENDYMVRYEEISDNVYNFWGISIDDETAIEYKIFYDKEYM